MWKKAAPNKKKKDPCCVLIVSSSKQLIRMHTKFHCIVHAYSNEMQAKVLVSFIVEGLRAQSIQSIGKWLQ